MAVIKRRALKGTVSCSCAMPGVWRAAAHNEGCVVVYHSPASCAHITSDMDRNRHFRVMGRKEYQNYGYRSPLVTTSMGKKESVFGGADRLRACLAFVKNHYNPQYIVVADSCLSGVIGDDTTGVCMEMEDTLGLPILHVDCHGFLDGEYYGAYIATGNALIERFTEPRDKEENTVILLGEKDGPKSSGMLDFCRLLESFDLKASAQFPGYATLEDLRKLGSAQYSMVVGGTPGAAKHLSKLARTLEEKFNVVPFEADYPVGWKATKRWIHQLATFLDKEERGEEAIDSLWKEFTEELAPMKPLLEKQEVVLYLTKILSSLDLTWVLEWCKLADMPFKKCILSQEFTEEERIKIESAVQEFYAEAPVEIEQQDTQIGKETIVVTTTELDERQLRQLILPCLPPIGTRGFLLMYRKMHQLAKRTPGKGVVFYGW